MTEPKRFMVTVERTIVQQLSVTVHGMNREEAIAAAIEDTKHMVIWDDCLDTAGAYQGVFVEPLDVCELCGEQILAEGEAICPACEKSNESGRQKGDDDGQEYGDPRDERDERLDRE